MALVVRTLALLLTLLVLASPPAPVSAAERSWSERQAGPLVVRYVGDDQAEFAWYADVAEQAYKDVMDVFGNALQESQVQPRARIVISLYGDDDAYAEANPVAAREEGVLGHANPVAGEIGIGVARLRERSEQTRRDSLRHELTHVVLGDLSNQHLPIGFQEGIAQYLERDLDQRRRFARTLRRGIEEGQLLHLLDLNRQRPFLSRAPLAYPESYAVVVYLAEQYGFGQVIKLVEATRDADTLDDATQRAFNHSVSDLEAEWQAFLPGFLDQGWGRNDLDLWDLAQPRQQLADGQYADALANLERAERMFTSVGRADRAELARTEIARAQAGLDATTLTQNGTAALAVFEYDTAADLLTQAERRWQDAGNAQQSDQVSQAAAQARDGQAAVTELAEARRQLDGWHFQEADDLAFAAGQALAERGDATRTQEARQVMADVRQVRTQLGLAIIGSGVAGIGALALISLASRRRRHQTMPGMMGAASDAPTVGVGLAPHRLAPPDRAAPSQLPSPSQWGGVGGAASQAPGEGRSPATTTATVTQEWTL